MQLRELSCKTLQIPMKTIKPKKRGKIPKKTGKHIQKKHATHFYRWYKWNHSTIGGLWHCFTHIIPISRVTEPIFCSWGSRTSSWNLTRLSRSDVEQLLESETIRKGHQLIGLVRGNPKMILHELSIAELLRLVNQSDSTGWSNFGVSMLGPGPPEPLTSRVTGLQKLTKRWPK